MSLRFGIAALVVTSVSSVLFAAAPARADGTIKNPDDHPHYVVELEPHAIFRQDNYFDSGFGLGGRFSFPIVDPGFVKKINNTIAIGTGLDVGFFNRCDYRGEASCSETVFSIPVVMQWNFYVAPHISVFGEPGVELNFYNFNDCPPGFVCNGYSHTHFAPFVLFGGMRYHFNEKIAITPRLGFDNYGAFWLSFGVSFFAGGG